MNVQNRCTLYNKFISKWEKYRDAVGGESYIKARGETYLPRATGMDNDDYKGYRLRAQFFNATGRTLNGLSGLINRKPMITDIPERYRVYLKNVDGKGHSIEQFGAKVVKDGIATGWGGILVDMPIVKDVKSQREFEELNLSAYMTYYKAESIINWHWGNDGRKMYLDYVIFQEPVEEITADYTVKNRYNYRVCEIKDGYYQQTLYDDKNNVIDFCMPSDKNGRFKSIPFWFISNDDSPQESMLEDLINVNLSHYRKSADYENGLHWTGVPTPWTQGANVGTIFMNGQEVAAEPLKLGGSVVQNLPAGASMHYLEFTGSGCSQLANAMKEDKDSMAVLGARIISQYQHGVEAAETAEIHYAAENSVLAEFANNLSIIFSKAVKLYLEWSSGTLLNDDECKCVFNTDYNVARMSAADLQAYVAAWQAGAISKRTMFNNIKEGEIIESSKTFEEEQAEIDEDQQARIPMQTIPQEELQITKVNKNSNKNGEENE